jgi:hypothetical protein
MLSYAIDNAAPATIILISGDRDFVYAVSVLRQRRYKIILIAPPSAHSSLKSQASIVFDWNLDILCKGTPQCPPTIEGNNPLSLDNTTRRPASFPPSPTLSSRSSSLPSTPQLSVCDDSFDSPFGDAVFVFTPYPGGDDGFISSEDWTAENGWDWENIPDEKAAGTLVSIRQEEIADQISDNRSSDISGILPDDIELATAEPHEGASLPATAFGLAANLATRPSPAVEQSAFHAAPTVNAPIQRGAATPLNSPPNLAGCSQPTIELSVPSDISDPHVTVPRQFIPLAKELRWFLSRGNSTPSRGSLGHRLASGYEGVYQDAQVKSFAKYVILAEQAGIVTLGGEGNTAYVSLNVAFTI